MISPIEQRTPTKSTGRSASLRRAVGEDVQRVRGGIMMPYVGHDVQAEPAMRRDRPVERCVPDRDQRLKVRPLPAGPQPLCHPAISQHHDGGSRPDDAAPLENSCKKLVELRLVDDEYNMSRCTRSSRALLIEPASAQRHGSRRRAYGFFNDYRCIGKAMRVRWCPRRALAPPVWT